MKKILFLLFITICFNINVNALELNSKYAVLYNLNDDRIIYELQKDEIISVASLTKIMTTLVAIENIKDFDAYVNLKEEMFYGLKEANAYIINLKPDQKVTYNDLLYGMFLASGADATRAIAITIAGSEEEYVKLMNNKAKELGLNNTHFQNTIGLDSKNHYSTVNDIAIILKSAYKNNKFKEIFTTETYTLSDGTITVSNSMKYAANKNKIDVSNILGAKTGYTGNAGRCLASIAYDKKNKITYLLVTTKALTTKQAIIDAQKTYFYYFKNYKYQNLINKNDLLVKINTKYSNQKTIKFYSPKYIKRYLKNDYSKSDIKLKYIGKDIITPKMKKDEKIGKVDVFYKNELIDSIDIKLQNKISFSLTGFIVYYKNIIIGILIFIVILIFFFNKKQRNKCNDKNNVLK